VLPRRFRGRPNYGWPYREGPQVHQRKRLRRYVRPALAYSHRIGTAVIGGHVVRDPRLPGYRGRYVYGDFCDGFVAVAQVRRRRARTRMSGLVVPGLTTFGEDAAHRLYLGTAYGQLYRLDPV
jgi:glucose/arabinose dehydrogenase